jgi:hypothetical protein
MKFWTSEKRRVRGGGSVLGYIQIASTVELLNREVPLLNKRNFNSFDEITLGAL